MKLETGIDLPSVARAPRRLKYPFGDMHPGDSFFVACEPETSAKLRQSIYVSSRTAASRYGAKYTTRVVEGGVRCWRVD